MSTGATVAWFVGTWLAIGIVAAWIKHRLRKPLPRRTPADVHRDVDAWRARRIAELEARANGWHINDDELADWLAIGEADYQAGCNRLWDAIDETREENGQ